MGKITVEIGLCISFLFLSLDLSSQVSINEIMASNASVDADLDFGSYCDWIELHNSGEKDLDLSGYFLSDDATNPGMWEFQSGTVLSAHSYLLVYADGRGYGLHCNFKLAKEGELLLLFDPQSRLIDSLSYPFQKTDISYGRSGDGSQQKGYFDSPTPGTANGNKLKKGISANPVFSRASGFYGTSISLSLSSADPLARIHYTTNGRSPKESDALYTGPLEIRETTVVRALTFTDNMLEGLTVTQSYFISEEQNLPVLSLATNPANFFSDDYGIYVEGSAGKPGYCTDVPHNVNQDWERAVNIELIEKDGTRGLNQVAGVKIFGGCSRVRYPMKSLAFYARKEYETDAFSYRLFPDKDNDKYETFILRASADDQPFTLIRDPLAQMLVKDVINVDVQAYRPVVVYINGEYWGIHNLREKINEHYAEDNFDVNSDSVDMVKRNPENISNVISGSADHYNAMIQYLKDNDISQDAHYEYINTQMDVDEYLNYQVIQIFFGGRDWPGNNIKFWRSREEPYNRWRWVLYDLDHVVKDFSADIMAEATDEDCGCTWPNPPWSTYLFRRLLENEAFKNEYLQRVAIYSTTHFSRERVHEYIDRMQAELAPEIPRHIERWGGARVDLPDNTWMSPIFSSVEKWEANVDVMRHFTDTRHELAVKQMNDYFGIEGLSALKVRVEPVGSGNIKIGGSLLPGQEFSGDFSIGSLIKAEGFAGPGYHFSHWISHDLRSLDNMLLSSGDQWKCLVSRDMPGSDWISAEYDDSDWTSGPSQLGYGDGDEATVLEYGGNSDNKNITTWFRKKVLIKDKALYEAYSLKLLRDDGARVYINGTEMVRDNMQRWSLSNMATAEAQVSGSDESEWHNFQLNPDIFQNGYNQIAVEIHQASSSSSDISFDLELIARSYEKGPEKIIREKELNFEMTDNRDLTAHMAPNTEAIDNLHINEIVASNSDDIRDELGEYEDWIEIYNSGEKTVDLAGLFLTDRLQGTQRWTFPADQAESTSVHAKGFILVFADGEVKEGPLHTNFKLSKAGEEVALLQKIGNDTLVIDHLVYGSQVTDVSFGRYPDGGIMFEYMSFTTPAGPNTLGTGIRDEENAVPNPEKSLTVYPVPTRGPLHIRFSEELASRDMQVRLVVYNMSGSVVHDSNYQSSSQISLSLENQARGMYLLRITSPDETFVKTVIVH